MARKADSPLPNNSGMRQTRNIPQCGVLGKPVREYKVHPNQAVTTAHREQASHWPNSVVQRGWARFGEREGMDRGQLLAAFLLSALAVFLRNPSLFTRPQFWAEDGSYWFAQAYNGGWLHSLTQPLGGYLNTLQRIGAGLALLVPFRWAPLVMNLEGLFMQALPVPILLSSRCRNWAPLNLRLMFAIVYIAIPNAREIHVVCTNCHWHLALAELFLAFAEPPHTLPGRVFDVAIFLLGSVCGPFMVLLLPLLGVYWWVRRRRWSLVIFGVLLAGSAVQFSLMMHFKEARHHLYLGASVAKFIRMLGGDVFIAMLRGSVAYGFYKPFLICLVAAIVGLGLIAYCFRSTTLELRLFLIYCFVVLAAGLRSPLTPVVNVPLWTLVLSSASLRYWFLPGLAFLFAILWCASFARSRIVRITSFVLIAVLCTGIVQDWRLKPLANLNFPAYAAIFQTATPGTHVIIPLNPAPVNPGDQLWQMELTKKP